MHSVSETDRPGRTEVSRNAVNFYKPQIENTRNSRSRPVPATYVRKDASGKVETVQRSAERNSVNTSSSRMKELDNSSRTTERSRSVESLDKENVRTPEVQRTVPNDVRREYPRSPNTIRSYERLETERQNNARDRFEAPPVQRAPSYRETQRNYQNDQRETQQRNFEMQRRNEIQRTQPTPRQNPSRQRESINMQRQSTPSYRENTNRSTTQPSQRSTQFRKSDSGNSGQPKTNTGSRSTPGRSRN